MYPPSGIILAAVLFFHSAAGAVWYRGNSLRYNPSSFKRQQLPYHPMARFRGADSRPYYGYAERVYPQSEYFPVVNQITSPPEPPEKMSSGELLALLFSNIKSKEDGKVRGTLRFGILRR